MKMLIKAMVMFLIALLIGSCDNSTESKKDDTEPDSTTQNFTFEEYEFGDGGNSSYFNDVWIFDENNIWAVGEVYHDPVIGMASEYNIVQWNGSKWIGRGRGFNSVGIYGIWPLDSSHIYFAVGIVLEYKNKQFNWMDFSQLNFSQGQSVEHLWGSSESNIWGAGPWGTLVHYDGNKWTKLEISTEITFRDITGIKGTGTAYALGYSENEGTTIYELKNGTYKLIYSTKELFGWTMTVAGNTIQITDVKIWRYDLDKKQTEILYNLPLGHSADAVSRAADNDIYYFGSSIEKQEYLTHYNGKRYKSIGLGYYQNNQGGSYAIKDLAVRVGTANNKARLVKIKRIQN